MWKVWATILAVIRGWAVRCSRQTGVVVEPGDDFDIGAVGQADVGEVGLPGLVGLVGLEADVGRLGAFRRFRGDHPGSGQDPVDRRPGQGDSVGVLEVPADRFSSGIQPGTDEATTDAEHEVDGLGTGRVR